MANQHPEKYFRYICEPEQQESVCELLHAQGFDFEAEEFSPICQHFTRLPFSPGLSLAAIFGYIYILDRSSMLPPLVLAPDKGNFVLDLCASPGSKTSFLAQLCGSAGMVLANEVNPDRLATLRKNLGRLNLFNVGTCNYDGRKLPLPNNSVPLVLLDPPCSGWGTALKNPAAPKLWQGKKIAPLLAIQRDLLRKSMDLLTPGGKLCYSTCTTNSDENEKQIEFAINELGSILIPLEPFPGFVFEKSLVDKGMLLVDGAASKSQGFFIALLQKKAKHGQPQAFPRFPSPEPIELPLPAPGPGEPALFGEMVRYIPQPAPLYLPETFSWQAPLLGKWSAVTGFQPEKNLRYASFFRQADLPSHFFEKITDLTSFLAGNEIKVDIKAKRALLWWHHLPLGICQIKNGRLINPFHQ